MRILLFLRCLLLCGVVGEAGLLAAQAAPPATTDSAYPEQAYLSTSRYVNQYFGFSVDLPEEEHLRPVPEAAARDGSIPLLDLAGGPPADAQILIAAIPTASGRMEDARLVLREALDQELYRGVEELHGLSKASLSGHQFYFFETRRGIEQHMLLATTVRDYILRVVVAGHDEKVVKRLEASFAHVTFFSPANAGQYLRTDAKPYDGPSMSSHRLAVLENDPPARHIDEGKINGDFYENPTLGFSYRIPQGWVLESSGAVQGAVENYQQKLNFGQPRMGRVERRLVDACSRTLFSAWAKRPSSDGHVSYDDFGEVTVSAMSTACLPTINFPNDAKDEEAFRSFVAEFALTHPIVNEMREAKVFTEDGVTVLFLHGTVAFQIPDDELSRRLSLGIAITQRRGYLVSWFFAAPHDSELRALTDERARFDAAISAKMANASEPGGGVAGETTSAAASSASTSVTNAAMHGSAASSASDANASPGIAGEAVNSATTNPGDGSVQGEAQDSSPHPTLLRPGESMESQQGKGAPIAKRGN